MQKRGGGRFGKYGDLKRKDKIRAARRLQRDDKVKASVQRSVAMARKEAGCGHRAPTAWQGNGCAPDRKPNGEAENS